MFCTWGVAARADVGGSRGRLTSPYFRMFFAAS